MIYSLSLQIYCFISARRFSYRADNLVDVYVVPNKVLKIYVIFTIFACFPFGFLALIAYNLVASNNIVVEEVKNDAGLHLGENEPEEKPTNVDAQTELSEKEKKEKFAKLQNFRDKGIITEEELEMAREQLFGKEK